MAFCTARCNTTDVERTQRQLGTRFTNGLTSDNTNGLAYVHQCLARQIHTIAFRAQSITVACQHTAHINRRQSRFINLACGGLGHQFTGGDDDFLGNWVNDIMCSRAPQHHITQWNSQCTALVYRFCGYVFVCSAIVFCDDRILGQFNQTTCQIPSVSRFQRRVGHTFARTVGGRKVFRHGQTLFKVRNNWNFDNRTVGLLHHTTHTSNLLNLTF